LEKKKEKERKAKRKKKKKKRKKTKKRKLKGNKTASLNCLIFIVSRTSQRARESKIKRKIKRICDQRVFLLFLFRRRRSVLGKDK